MSNRHGVTVESLGALASGDKDHLRAVVHAYIRKSRYEGTTDDAMSEALGLPHHSVAPRRTGLEDDGLVSKLFDSDGQRVRRKTRSGCWAGVYVALEFAPRTSAAPKPTMVHEPPALIASAPTETLFGDLAPEDHRDFG